MHGMSRPLLTEWATPPLQAHVYKTDPWFVRLLFCVLDCLDRLRLWKHMLGCPDDYHLGGIHVSGVCMSVCKVSVFKMVLLTLGMQDLDYPVLEFFPGDCASFF